MKGLKFFSLHPKHKNTLSITYRGIVGFSKGAERLMGLDKARFLKVATRDVDEDCFYLQHEKSLGDHSYIVEKVNNGKYHNYKITLNSLARWFGINK